MEYAEPRNYETGRSHCTIYGRSLMNRTIFVVITIVGIIASLITIWLFLSQQITRFLGRIILQLINSAVPGEPVRIVPHQQTCKWGKSEKAEKASMRVSGVWYVTNIAETPARIITDGSSIFPLTY